MHLNLLILTLRGWGLQHPLHKGVCIELYTEMYWCKKFAYFNCICCLHRHLRRFQAKSIQSKVLDLDNFVLMLIYIKEFVLLRRRDIDLHDTYFKFWTCML
jgi:hypothetical protein